MAQGAVRVVFVSTVFEDVDTGPGIYARYLWESFRDDPAIEFHLVVPKAGAAHPRLYAVGEGRSSMELYRRVREGGRAVLARLGPGTVLHGNSAHSLGGLEGHPGPKLVQVNDYEVATVWRRALDTLARRGPRRVLALAWRYRHERNLLRAATCALCNSDFTAQEVRREYGLAAERCRTVYKAVDTSAFVRPSPLPPDPLPGRRAGRRLLFVGSDWPRKGLDVLLDAVGRLTGRWPDLTLTVAGPELQDRVLRERIDASGFGDRVLLAGRLRRDALATYLWHADLLVLPSRQEALGVAILEAMAAGVPVVATRVGGIPEIVRDGTDGLLVEPEDPVALADAIAGLLADGSRREGLAEAGRRRAAEFAVERMTTTLRSLYLSVAGAREMA